MTARLLQVMLVSCLAVVGCGQLPAAPSRGRRCRAPIGNRFCYALSSELLRVSRRRRNERPILSAGEP